MAGKYDKNIKITVSDDGKLKKTTKNIDNLNKAQQRHNKSSQTMDRNLKGNAAMSANASKNFSKQAQSMQGVLVPAYAEVAARVFALTAAYTALQRASQFDILLKGQQTYAAQTGKNMAQIARSIQAASGYMLDFKQASSSTALASTAGLTAKQIVRMTKGARAASVALGRDMTDAMDRLTRGIVKAEPEILDELGVIIRLDKVYKDFAVSVGKSTAELTEMEKLTARNAAIMGQLDSKFGDIANSIPADAFSKLSATVTDMVLNLGSGATSALGPLISKLADTKELLAGIMLIIARSLITKVFPMFDNLGRKMDGYVKKLNNLKDALEKSRLDRLSKLGAGGLTKAETEQTKKFFDIIGDRGGKAFTTAVARDGKNAATILGKSAAKGLTMAIRFAKADIAEQQAAGIKESSIY